jgi:hypothetical protein
MYQVLLGLFYIVLLSNYVMHMIVTNLNKYSLGFVNGQLFRIPRLKGFFFSLSNKLCNIMSIKVYTLEFL